MDTPIHLPRSVYAEKLRGFSDFAFSDQAAFQFRGQWKYFFRKRIGQSFDGRLILEVGCFDAGYLSKIAMKYPGSAFVGLDWKCKPIHDGAQRISELQLNNVALLRARGSDIGRIFADGEVDEIWVFHPEVAKGEAVLKTRLIGEPFLIDGQQILRDSSVLSFKTDHSEYFQWMLGLFGKSDIASVNDCVRNRFDLTMQSENYWHDPAALAHTSARCFAGEATLYERRFMNKRRNIYFVEMRKKTIA